MKQKTRKGATSMIVIIFFTMLAGILVLSFASLMITNMRETTNYSLSQSAYDAALAGTEDAKVMLIEYNNCVSRGDSTSARCSDIMTNLNASDASDDCDVVRKALNRSYDSGENETPVRSERNTGAGGAVDNSLEMAYTCVKVNVNTNDYLGKLENDKNFWLIPLRAVGDVNVVRVSWFNKDDKEGLEDSDYEMIDGALEPYGYTKNPILPPPLDVGLIQAPTNGIDLDDFKSNYSANSTNRGLIEFRPKLSASNLNKKILKANDPNNFANSVSNGKILNSSPRKITRNTGSSLSPVDIDCGKYSDVPDGYHCNANIELPNARFGSSSSTTNNDIRFLTLSLPYQSPSVSFSVSMYRCDRTDRDIDHPGNCKLVKFNGVQSSIDATGRANNVFRRIESRVEAATDILLPKSPVNLYEDDSSEVKKTFETTTNCWHIDKGINKTCTNYTEVNVGF